MTNKLTPCLTCLDNWGEVFFGEVGKKVKLKQKQLEDFNLLERTEKVTEEIKRAESELDELLA